MAISKPAKPAFISLGSAHLASRRVRRAAKKCKVRKAGCHKIEVMVGRTEWGDDLGNRFPPRRGMFVLPRTLPAARRSAQGEGHLGQVGRHFLPAGLHPKSDTRYHTSKPDAGWDTWDTWDGFSFLLLCAEKSIWADTRFAELNIHPPTSKTPTGQARK